MTDWIQTLTPFILFLLVVIVVPLIKNQISKIKDDRLRGMAKIAVGRAEEIGRTYLKENGNGKLAGSSKEIIAKNIMKELAGKAKIKLKDSEAEILIQATLGLLALDNKR